MILESISYLDCIVFLIFLTPQLIIHVGFFPTSSWVLGAFPFLLCQLPFSFVKERYFTQKKEQSPFVQHATAFQDVVIRCVRYAFAFMPASIGRIFFSKAVALPFLRFRMLRHGYLRSPLPWTEIKRDKFKGIWIAPNLHQDPDIVVFYCHGGGFSMGSSYFYMEFLIAWVALLQQAGYKNPALFALEYTLVPDACYPTQVQEVFAGYEYILSIVGKSSRVCIGGDSAGATLVLSFLLYISEHPEYQNRPPGLAVMISPWVTIISEKNRNTRSDYLDKHSLHLYGSQYAGSQALVDDPLVSPGKCKNVSRWARASPKHGWIFLYGSEEVLAPEIRDLIQVLAKAESEVEVDEEDGGIHAWPVASLYLGATRKERLKGVQHIVNTIRKRVR